MSEILKNPKRAAREAYIPEYVRLGVEPEVIQLSQNDRLAMQLAKPKRQTSKEQVIIKGNQMQAPRQARVVVGQTQNFFEEHLQQTHLPLIQFSFKPPNYSFENSRIINYFLKYNL